MRNAVDIIIPAWNQAELTVRCLETIRMYSSHYRIIFIDNGSDEAEFRFMYQELINNPHLLVRNSENLGFVKAVNQGLRLAAAPYIVIMNNDTEAVGGWIEKLMHPLQVDYRTGAAGPRATADGSWQGRWEGTEGWLRLPESAMLAFFCTMFRHDVIKNVGMLDESFGVGLGDDDDYSRRIINAGYRLALVQDLVIPHHHRTTFRSLYSESEITEMQDTAMQRYKEKHDLH